mmetsp:Transcript_32894/g.83287  ORF Transcript_32894/g.83287 Transcript_32894/m.83287 type:complete len:215 (+) Transcript_32894:1484-2128(+)
MYSPEFNHCPVVFLVRDFVWMPSSGEFSVCLCDCILVRASWHIKHQVRVFLLLLWIQNLLRRVHHAKHSEDKAVITRCNVPDFDIFVYRLLTRGPHSASRSHTADKAQPQPEAAVPNATSQRTRPCTLCPQFNIPKGKLKGLVTQRYIKRHMPIGLWFAWPLRNTQLTRDDSDAQILPLLVLHRELDCPSIHPLYVIHNFAHQSLELQGTIFTP